MGILCVKHKFKNNNMINIKCFGKRKENTTSSTSTGGGASAGSARNINGVYLWGQYHDHTNDVNGDMTVNGDIIADGNITSQGNISAQGDINTQGGITAQGDINTQGDISGVNLTLTDDITCDDINSRGDIHTVDINCANINCTGDIVTDNIIAQDGTMTNLFVDFLTVTKQAHFFELVIDKIKSNAGQVILSAANAIIDKVVAVTDGYKLYWRREDAATGKKIENLFQLNDQVRCQTFNVHQGANFNVANKYYWRLVTDTGSEIIDVDGSMVECNYIEVSDTDKDGTSIPEAGDEIVQLGNRTDTTRQNAIIMSAVTSPDPNVTAPSIVQYKGINSYTLNNKILNQMAANGNTFTGNFMVVNGNTVDNVLNLITGNQPMVKTDSDAVFMMVNSSYELDNINDAQNLPYNIKLYDGSNIVNYSDWTVNSRINNGWQTVMLKPADTFSDTGLYISEISADGSGGCDITWNFTQDHSVYSNYYIEIYIEWLDGSILKHITKTIPVNVISQSTSIAGADAEFDRLQILTGDATVGVDNTLSVAFTAQVLHVKGDTVTISQNLNNLSMDVMYNNSGGAYSATKDGNRFVFTDTVTDFSLQPTLPTNISFMLIKRDGPQYVMLDNIVIPIKFNAGSIFEVKDDAITAAVTASNGYTDTQIGIVNLTAQGLESRVTNIENDYVTGSQLTQTANQITLNVYDELRNNTGIDIQSGQITLNANNTTINGNLNLMNADNGITIYDNDGTARIQLQPDEIGNINDFDGGAQYQVRTRFQGQNLSTFSQTTEKTKIGQFSASDTLTMTNLHCFFKSYENGNEQQQLITDNITAAIKIYREGNNTAVATFNRTFTYSSVTGEHTTNDISYTIPSTGVYLFNATFTYNVRPQYSNVYEEVYAIINQTVQHQTYIGSDGMYCNPQHDAMLWAGSDAIVMRWNNDGVRVDNNCLKRAVVGGGLNNVPTWLPFDNYVHVKTLSSTYYTLSSNRYVYNIQPAYDVGIIAAACPSFNTSNRATHIVLPSFVYYDTGVEQQLPVGYKVQIVNTDAINYTGSMSSNKYIYVDDTNLNHTWQVTGTIMTFVHIGGGLWTTYAN